MTLRHRWRYEGEQAAPTHRLEALADGVFSIVMTLLVLELGIPIVADISDRAIGEALAEMWPEFLIYGLSFLVLGTFWLMHKMIFDAITASDPPLVWLNVLFLMITALLPFSTALVGEYRAVTVVAAVYGLNLMLAFAAAWAIWGYAAGRGLLADEADPMMVRGATRMGLVYFLVLAAATAVAFASPVLSYLAHAGFVGVVIGLTMMGRWESAMIWARSGDRADDGESSG